ncbi:MULTISPECIES: DNA-directed RNA polymerase subunit alpha C-terminal domain-containing protein [Niastella]|uniref:RNA polymerase alpha subunit C-terminal domain-containing protein n=1 Tax=Niastella soli TaxID=2821487 RepID=A0ABS3YU76_9BACT|nr:DNA-directed RNA polymerase subunit alpha C-terminal domain-containing protein [Niastella soli]MBO9201399.1 hypothetical protein [Niastella soli]
MDRYTPDILFVQRSIQLFDVNKCKILAHWLDERIRTMEIDKQQFKTSITELNLSKRALHVLQYNNIITIGQLLAQAVNWDNIYVLRGAGAKVREEIYNKVVELRKQR